jgi:hypothetical protein
VRGSGPVALSEPDTARALPRPRYGAWALAVLGVVVLLGWAIGTTVVRRAAQELRQEGRRTTGTVVTVHTGIRGASDRAVVAFVVDGEPIHATVDLGSDGVDHPPGSEVSVYYDPADPERITLGGIDNPPPGWGWLVDVSGPAGLVWTVLGVIGTVGDRRRRGQLRATLTIAPWTQVHLRIGYEGHDPVARQVSPRDTVLSTPDGTMWHAPAGWPSRVRDAWEAPATQFDERYGWRAPAVHGRDAWCVVNGDLAVFSPDRGEPLLMARRLARRPFVPGEG